jgi:L-lactate dehydrogenase complex protein LldE
MKVALFVPCFIDAFYPEVGIAALELLERLGLDVDYPGEQTCCGQPMANSGAQKEAAGAERVFARNFADYDYVVGPSASCVHHVREHFTAIEQTAAVRKVRASAFDLTEFLHDVLKVREFPWAEFPHRVGLHNSCSAIRHLNEVSRSEIAGPAFSKPRALLECVKGIEFVTPARPDECCGFGGTFSVTEEAVSVRMGQDKVRDHVDAGAQYIVSGDMSCLMHQQGCAERLKLDARFIHIAQILNGARG